MNKGIKFAAERFDKLKGRDFLINPISNIDGEIICELIEVLRKAGLNEVKEILKSYKEVKDQDILDSLMQWHLDNSGLANKIVEGEEDEEKKPSFFIIGELMFREYHLLGLETYDYFSEKEQDQVWGIRLNPALENAKSLPLYSNKEIEFLTEENRKNVLHNLSIFLLENDMDIIQM
jgi:hypothetical protein